MIWYDCSYQKHFESCSKYPQQCDKCEEEGIERDKVLILRNHFWYTIFSIITQVIIEICVVWLVKDYVIYYYNQPMWGDYKTEALISNGHYVISWCFWRNKQNNKNQKMQLLW